MELAAPHPLTGPVFTASWMVTEYGAAHDATHATRVLLLMAFRGSGPVALQTQLPLMSTLPGMVEEQLIGAGLGLGLGLGLGTGLGLGLGLGAGPV